MAQAFRRQFNCDSAGRDFVAPLKNAQSFSPVVNGSMGVFPRAVSVMTMAGPISMDHTSLASCSSDVKARNSVLSEGKRC